MTYETVKSEIEKLGHKLVSKKYVNNKIKLDIICGNCGKSAKQTYDRIKRGFGCGCKQEGFKYINEKQRFTTLYEHVCKYCKNRFYNTRTKQVHCSIECAHKTQSEDDRFKEYGRKGYLLSKSRNRSKNEIYFSQLCIEKWGDESIFTNEPVFDGFDSDVIISHLKVAVEWNGIWHYKKVKESHDLKKKQRTDRIKKSIITKKYGWGFYVIKDMGSHNKKYVEEQFDLFVSKIDSIVESSGEDAIEIQF